MATFCQVLAASGIVGWACKQAGINRTTAYGWRKKWKTFADRWEQALEEFGESLEGEALWRAKNRDRAASSSDAMLQFLLRANKPDKYVNKSDVTHHGDGDLRVIVEYINQDTIANPASSAAPNDGTGEEV